MSALVSENPGGRGSLDWGPAAIIPVCELPRNVHTYRANGLSPAWCHGRARVVAGPSLEASIPAEPWWCQVMRLCQGSSLELSLLCTLVLLRAPSQLLSLSLGDIASPAVLITAQLMGWARQVLCTTGHFSVPARRAKLSLSQHICRSGLSGG